MAEGKKDGKKVMVEWVRGIESVEEEGEELVVNTKIRGGHALLGGVEVRKQATDMLTEEPHEPNVSKKPAKEQGA